MARSRLQRLALSLLRPLWRWRRFGLWSEVLFWHLWARRFRNPSHPHRWLLDPKRPLSPEIQDLLAASPSTPLRILEVGAGPITSMGLVHPERQVEIVPTDLLASRYARILKRHGIEPPLPTVFADAERLTEQFGENRFDLVFATNCIDHTADPLRAVRQMVAVTKPGGYVLMYHEVDEAEHQDYAGLHQWNLAEREGRFVVWNRSRSFDLSALLAPSCMTEAGVRDGLLRVLICKRAA
ncbi:MAG TPA: class I SAM-dependent methyltransferase [Thermoanaerobaculia bacterium]|jgi:SAM-dependent methyltransferase